MLTRCAMLSLRALPALVLASGVKVGSLAGPDLAGLDAAIAAGALQGK